jgi:hypothetical protein
MNAPKNGCFCYTFPGERPPVRCQNGWTASTVASPNWIDRPDRSSPLCRYDKRHVDPACCRDGLECAREWDEDYLRSHGLHPDQLGATP